MCPATKRTALNEPACIQTHLHYTFLLLPVDLAHHGFDIHWSGGSGSLGFFLLFLLPEDDGVDARAPVESILLQVGRTWMEIQTLMTKKPLSPE